MWSNPSFIRPTPPHLRPKPIQICLGAGAREDLNSIKRWWVAALNATQDLENIVSTACVPVFAIDLEGRVVEWNDNLRKLTGAAAMFPCRGVIDRACSASGRVHVNIYAALLS